MKNGDFIGGIYTKLVEEDRQETLFGFVGQATTEYYRHQANALRDEPLYGGPETWVLAQGTIKLCIERPLP